jgi:hypothetical protein
VRFLPAAIGQFTISTATSRRPSAGLEFSTAATDAKVETDYNGVGIAF